MKMNQPNYQYNMMDVTKFVFAIFLVCAHTASEKVVLHPVLDLVFSLYIIIVPFFFIASSFLFFKKVLYNTKGESLNSNQIHVNMNNAGGEYKYHKWSKRIWLMYLSWSLVYFIFIAVNWINDGVTFDVIIDWLHKSAVYSTYPTIWFLPALWFAVSITYFFKCKIRLSSYSITFISILFYLFGSVGYSYHSLNPFLEIINEKYISIMITWRNGIFNGFVYASIGLLIADKGHQSIKNCILGSVLFGALFLFEAFLMKKIAPASDANFLLMLVPFSYYFFNLICNIKLPDSSIYLPLRKMSMLIFLSQRLFLTAIPSVTSGWGIWRITDNAILALLLVVIEVVFFSYLILKASDKVKILKYLV